MDAMPVDIVRLLGAEIADGWPALELKAAFPMNSIHADARPALANFLRAGPQVDVTPFDFSYITKEALSSHVAKLQQLSLVSRGWREAAQSLWRPIYLSTVRGIGVKRASARRLAPHQGTHRDLPARWYQLRLQMYVQKPQRAIRKAKRTGRHRARVLMGYVSKKQRHAQAHVNNIYRELKQLAK